MTIMRAALKLTAMTMRLPPNKTKIVATIGPASRTPAVLKRMLRAGMNVARLNFSHGDLETHRSDIRAIRKLASELGLTVAILADLPGPKIRIGTLEGGSLVLKKGERVTMTTRDLPGKPGLIPVRFQDLPRTVAKGSVIYLNDGFIQLKVLEVKAQDVLCRVIIGGQLLSHKGLNLPGVHIGVDAVTARDLELVRFAVAEGIDAVSISFVEDVRDIDKVRAVVRQSRHPMHVIAKIERREATRNIDAILEAADGIMVARGDLGVEIPIEEVPIAQKRLIFKANLAGKPVITATQMLESMTGNIRPTRAEVTDVANAILDGTDAVMLSEETAIGAYPSQTVAMMARIARVTEKGRASLATGNQVSEAVRTSISRPGAVSEDVISLDVIEALKTLKIRYVLAPTLSGGTPRRIARYKAGTWILAFTTDDLTRNFLNLSSGVYPVVLPSIDSDDAIIAFLKKEGLIRSQDKVLITRHLPYEKLGKVNALKILTLA